MQQVLGDGLHLLDYLQTALTGDADGGAHGDEVFVWRQTFAIGRGGQIFRAVFFRASTYQYKDTKSSESNVKCH